MNIRILSFHRITLLLTFIFVSSSLAEPVSIDEIEAITIQVSAFRERQEAENEVMRLSASGVDAVIRHEAVAKKGMWYRVYVGRFEKAAQAHAYAETLKDQNIITWSWVKTSSLPDVTVQSSTPPPERKPAPVMVIAAAQAEKVPSPTSATQANVELATSVAQSTDGPTNPPTSSSSQWTEVGLEKIVQQSSGTLIEDEPEAAKNFEIHSQTTLRAFNRDTSENEDHLVLPIYQYLQIGYGNSEQGGWSMQAYGWGRSDLVDSAYFEDDNDAEFLYAYLDYRKPYSDFNLRIGRQNILTGVVNENLDGLKVGFGLWETFSATVFGGVTATTEESSSNATYGGRLAIHPQPHYEIGLAYQSTDLEDETEQKAGLDMAFSWSHWLIFQGLSSYRLDTEGWREHSYSASLRYNDLSLEPSFQFFSYQDYFDTAKQKNTLFQFLEDSDELVTIIGGSLQYQGLTPVRVATRVNQYTYDVREENADYFAGLLSVDMPGGSQIGVEAGRMDGETDDNTYTLYRAHFYWNDPFGIAESTFISADGILQFYDEPVFGKDSAENYSISAGMSLLDNAMEVKLTGSFSQDPYFDEDVEGIFTLLYNY